MRVAIIGGGGFRTPLLINELRRTGYPVDELVLHDISEDRLAVIRSVLAAGPYRLRTTTELTSALRGTDLIFLTIRVGGIDGRVADERICRELGLLGQETVGAGGVRYALRTIPVVDRLAAAVAEFAPNAWVVSLTNPAGVVTEAMADCLGRRVIGVCDSPVALVRRAAAAAGMRPATSLARLTQDLAVDYLGLNHLGWLRGLRSGQVDLLARLLDEPARLDRIEEGRLFGADTVVALGALPNEYLYWYYAEHDALIALAAAERGRGEHVRERQRRFYANVLAAPDRGPQLWRAANEERNRSYFAELRTGERDEEDVSVGGYESVAVGVAACVTGLAAPARYIVNARNGATVAALPGDAVIETLSVVDSAGATPLPTAAPNLHQLGLMATVKGGERDVIAAARSGDERDVLRALVGHPLVASLAAARRLAAAMGEGDSALP